MNSATSGLVLAWCFRLYVGVCDMTQVKRSASLVPELSQKMSVLIISHSGRWLPRRSVHTAEIQSIFCDFKFRNPWRFECELKQGEAMKGGELKSEYQTWKVKEKVDNKYVKK